MNIKKMKLPIIIIVVGMIVAVASCLLTGTVKEPVIKEHDFKYSVTYKLDGEVKTFEGVFKCSSDGHEEHDDPTCRKYVGEYAHNLESPTHSSFVVANKDGVELSIITEFDAAYMMGDPDKYQYESGNRDPYLEAVDSEGYGVDEHDLFDVEIISWDYPEPIENSFKFVGFSRLHAISMFATLLVGVLTIIACIIFVRKNNDVSYKVLDTLSIVANFIIGFTCIPFITIVIFFLPLTMDATSILYQVYLCTPALSAFAIAASVALRRKGFTKSGFFVQFVCPVMFVGSLLVESIIYYLFF
jgi:hypothetical protein